MSLAVGVAKTVLELVRLGLTLGAELAREEARNVTARTLRIVDRRKRVSR